MDQLKTPVVLFTFKRFSTIPAIFKVLRSVKPLVLYIFSDGPRNDTEKPDVLKTRELILKEVDWPCTLHTYFQEKNQGVFAEIGLGAKKVLSIESNAIFLEDDNLPAVSFFRYCEDMLSKYKGNSKILWVCGTNYLGDSPFLDGDYCLTQQMLPCGWATWSEKFLRYYQTSFSSLNDQRMVKIVKHSYKNRALFRQQYRNFKNEKYREEHGLKFASWDYHMAFSLRLFGLYGIAPRLNQITNIGVDACSTHGGSSWNHPNTKNFCGVPTKEFVFPLKDPAELCEDKLFERNISKKILVPWYIRIMFPLITVAKKILGIYPDGSFSDLIQRKKK